MDKTRSLYWDLVKGLGIFAIVLGHCENGPVAAVVYLFHVVLFFFVTGCLFHEDKYGDNPYSYFSVRLSGVWPRYMFYSLLFVLIHNFFVRAGICPGQPLYSHTAMLSAFLNNSVFFYSEVPAGPLWFIPVWLFSSVLFCGSVWFGRRLSARLSLPSVKMPAIIFCSLGLGLIGLFLDLRGQILYYHLELAFLAVPFYLAGWLLKTRCPRFRIGTTWYGCLISAVLLYLTCARFHILIDLVNVPVPGLWFYPISLLGIYFCLSLADTAEKISPLAKLLAFYGHYSFDIMALHILVFKLTDLAYVRLFLRTAADSLAAFPAGFPKELVLWYPLLGLTIPALAGCGLDALSRFLSEKRAAASPKD